jgi:hypothetical protein
MLGTTNPKPNIIEINKITHMHTNKKHDYFCDFLCVLNLDFCMLQVSFFKTQKRRLENYTMGINPQIWKS